MNRMYHNLDVIVYYTFKDKCDFILMDVNTLAVYILDEIENNILKVISKYPENNELNTFIEKYGELIVADNIDELLRNGILRKKEEQNETDKKKHDYDKDLVNTINTIDILISQDYNLACKYYFVKNDKYHSKSALMEFDIGKKTIDFLIREAGNQENLFVCIFFGKPLLNFNVLENIVICALEEGRKNNKYFHFSLTTNGTLLSDEIVEFIHKYQISLLISIDGDLHFHNLNRSLSGGDGSYVKILNNLKKIDQRNISYSARTTVSSFTINKIAENFEHLISLGFKKIHFENALAPKGNVFITNKSDIEDIKKQYSKISQKICEIIKSGQSYNIETFSLPLKGIIEKIKNFTLVVQGKEVYLLIQKGIISVSQTCW